MRGRYFRFSEDNIGQQDVNDGTVYPGVSIIVAARNEADNLRPYLYHLLEQDYPVYEVIVINDGSEDNTQDVIDDYKVRYKNLHTTFVPRQARVKSTKKLALTLGVKAAKYDHLVFTDADCCPASRKWLKALMLGYSRDERIEIVLGMGGYFKEHTILNRLIQYETLTSSLQYLGMAAAGRPYMGVGRNMSYLKQVYVRNDGFTHIAGETAGDDDLFINRAANRKNTTVVMSRESVTWSVPMRTWKEWYQQRKRHLSVSHLYRLGSKLTLLLEPLTRGICYVTVIGLILAGSSISAVLALSLILLRWLLLLLVLNISAHRIGLPKIGVELMLWDVLYPLITVWILSQPVGNTGWK